MAKNRELSQLGSFVVVNDTNGNIGIATTATPSVGIGTTNPQAKLHVVSDAIIGELQITSAGIVTSSNPGVSTIKYYGDGSNLIGVNAFNVIGQDLATSPVYPTFASNIGVTSVGIASTQVAYIPSTNRFGIGTTNPTQNLDVTGNVRIRGAIYDGINNSAGLNLQVPVADGAGGWSWQPVTNAGAGVLDGITVKEEGSVVGTSGSITDLNFIGSNVTVTASVGGAIATITSSDTPTFNDLSVTGISTLGNVKIFSGIITSSNPGVTTVVYYGDGSKLFGVSAFAVINQDLSPDVVYPTLANNSGVSTVGIATTGTTSFVFKPTTGNVGLGSTQPAYKIDAVGDINITGAYRVGGRSVLDDALIYSIVFG